MRTRIKICGLTHPQHAVAAAQAGADAIGLVFYPQSSRVLGMEQACRISAAVPAFVCRVALFLDATADEIAGIIAAVRPDALQFHGNESPEFCRSFDLPYLKAVPMADAVDPGQYCKEYNDAAALLMDGHSAGQSGGSGTTFDWNKAGQPRTGPPIILAGGLDPANVGVAIRTAQPYGVDVSSGVETAPGIKDARLMQNFCDAVYRVERG